MLQRFYINKDKKKKKQPKKLVLGLESYDK